ncbi:MAG: GNAT family N-acetyltransferase [Chloroflexi bacterium]|nr:GNAT family N-acetyltransferase [Chloroflexota bacterium]
MSSHHQRPARGWPIVVRRARPSDKEAALQFATNTWHGWDYIPRVWDRWLVAPDSALLVATAGHGPAGAEPVDSEGMPLTADVPIAMTRVVMLTETEAWLEGVRVDPRVRGLGVATDLQVAEFRWAASRGARTVRYVTGQDNEGSHRLGAKHGMRVVTAYRWYGWDDAAEGAVRPEPTGALGGAAGDLALSPDADLAAWWSRVASDRTFRSAEGLFEIRSWAFALLTRERFQAQVERSMVLVWPHPRQPLADDGAWALAVLRGGPEGEDDIDTPLPPALLLGHPRPALELARAIGGGRPGLPRIRLPDPEPPLLVGTGANAWAQAGWPAAERTAHILGREIDRAHPLPEPAHPELLEFTPEDI